MGRPRSLRVAEGRDDTPQRSPSSREIPHAEERGTPKSCLRVERQAPITELPDVPIDRVGDVVISIDVPDDIVELMAVPEGR